MEVIIMKISCVTTCNYQCNQVFEILITLKSKKVNRKLASLTNEIGIKNYQKSQHLKISYDTELSLATANQ